jgi:hypothetical protein
VNIGACTGPQFEPACGALTGHTGEDRLEAPTRTRTHARAAAPSALTAIVFGLASWMHATSDTEPGEPQARRVGRVPARTAPNSYSCDYDTRSHACPDRWIDEKGSHSSHIQVALLCSPLPMLSRVWVRESEARPRVDWSWTSRESTHGPHAPPPGGRYRVGSSTSRTAESRADATRAPSLVARCEAPRASLTIDVTATPSAPDRRSVAEGGARGTGEDPQLVPEREDFHV